jgi:YD repeat-containing protein
VTHTDQTVWQFNNSGKLTAQSDRNGNHINYGYDSGSGHLNAITDSAGRNYSLVWDTTNNKLLSITDTTNRQVKLSYANGGTRSLETFTDLVVRLCLVCSPSLKSREQLHAIDVIHAPRLHSWQAMAAR